jgi:hypothetical protein
MRRVVVAAGFPRFTVGECQSALAATGADPTHPRRSQIDHPFRNLAIARTD